MPIPIDPVQFFDIGRQPSASAPVGGPVFSTSVQTMPAGHDQRVRLASSPLRRWSVGTPTRNDLSPEMQAFFRARGGRARGFLFRDPFDYRAVRQTPRPSGDPDTWQLVRHYLSGGVHVQRDLRRIDAGSFALRQGGALVDPGDYTLDASTGLLTWNGFAPIDILWVLDLGQPEIRCGLTGNDLVKIGVRACSRRLAEISPACRVGAVARNAGAGSTIALSDDIPDRNMALLSLSADGNQDFAGALELAETELVANLGEGHQAAVIFVSDGDLENTVDAPNADANALAKVAAQLGDHPDWKYFSIQLGPSSSPFMAGMGPDGAFAVPDRFRFRAAFEAILGELFSASFEFFVPVRLDTDRMNFHRDGLVFDWPSLELVEVREGAREIINHWG